MKKTIIAIAALATTAVATPALAGQMQVKYSDLNLATPEGQERLERRIDRAAREICEVDTVRTGTRVRSASARSCYIAAKKSAQQQFAQLVDEARLGG